MVTIPWCTENARNVMASPASTPSTLWCDNIRVERVWQSKPRVLEKRHWRMEIRKQPTLQNPCSVWPRSPEAWHRNPCFTQQPENLLKTDLQNFAKNAFSKIVPDQGEKDRHGQEFYICKILSMSVSRWGYRLIWAAKALEQLTGLIFFKARYMTGPLTSEEIRKKNCCVLHSMYSQGRRNLGKSLEMQYEW